MTDEDKIFLRKMLADLSVFPHVDIDSAAMARCFRLMIIKTLDENVYVERQKGGTKPKRTSDDIEIKGGYDNE